MVGILNIQPGEKRSRTMEVKQIQNINFLEVSLTIKNNSFLDTRYIKKTLKMMHERGVYRLIWDKSDFGKIDLTHFDMADVSVIRLNRLLAPMIVDYLYEEDMTISIHASKINVEASRIIWEICDKYRNVQLCIGQAGDILKEEIYEEIGFAPVEGETDSPKLLRLMLDKPLKENLRQDIPVININLTGSEQIFDDEYVDTILVSEDVKCYNDFCRQKIISVICDKDPLYRKNVKVCKVIKKL